MTCAELHELLSRDLTNADACRYRKFNLGGDVELVVRSELDGVMNYKGQDQLLSIKALNEFDPKHTGEPRQHLLLRCHAVWKCLHVGALSPKIRAMCGGVSAC